MLVEIDERYCIGCGRCVDDCVGANLEVEGVTARVKGLCIRVPHRGGVHSKLRYG